MSLDEMNQLTLECLVNKHQYQKYLAKTNPLLFEEQLRFSWKVKRYNKEIIDMVIQCLDDYSPSNIQKTQIQQSFQDFLKECIYQIESNRHQTKTTPLVMEMEEKEDMLIYAPIPVKGSIPIEYWKKCSVTKQD